MKKNINAAKLAFVLCTFGMLVISGFARANNTGDNWETDLSVYLWGAGINGSTPGGAEIDVGFDDIISELDFALMGTIESRKGKWTVIGDVVFLNVSADKSTTLPILPVDVKADLSLEGLVITLLGGYNVNNSGNNVTDIVFGMRYFKVDTSVQTVFNGSLVRGQSVSEDVYDAVIGVKGELGLNEKWFMPYYFDVGTGQSDSTIQVLGGIGYKYSWGDLQLVYRHLEWNLDDDSLLSDIGFSGPIFGGTFHF